MNPPQFEQLIYTFSISESTPIGAILAQIEAVDADEGLNSTITYKISGENEMFGVDANTGEIMLKQQMQYHLEPKHYFVLEATDQVKILF